MFRHCLHSKCEHGNSKGLEGRGRGAYRGGGKGGLGGGEGKGGGLQ